VARSLSSERNALPKRLALTGQHYLNAGTYWGAGLGTGNPLPVDQEYRLRVRSSIHAGLVNAGRASFYDESVVCLATDPTDRNIGLIRVVGATAVNSDIHIGTDSTTSGATIAFRCFHTCVRRQVLAKVPNRIVPAPPAYISSGVPAMESAHIEENQSQTKQARRLFRVTSLIVGVDPHFAVPARKSHS
jgi:hypothetical protein